MNEMLPVCTPDKNRLGLARYLFDSIEYFSYKRNREALSFYLKSIDITDVQRSRLGNRLKIFGLYITFEDLINKNNAPSKDWENAISKLKGLREELIRKGSNLIVYPNLLTSIPAGNCAEESMFETTFREPTKLEDTDTELLAGDNFFGKEKGSPFHSIITHCRVLQAASILRSQVIQSRAAKNEATLYKDFITTYIDDDKLKEFLLNAIINVTGGDGYQFQGVKIIKKILSNPGFTDFEEAIKNYLEEIEIASLGLPLFIHMEYDCFNPITDKQDKQINMTSASVSSTDSHDERNSEESYKDKGGNGGSKLFSHDGSGKQSTKRKKTSDDVPLKQAQKLCREVDDPKEKSMKVAHEAQNLLVNRKKGQLGGTVMPPQQFETQENSPEPLRLSIDATAREKVVKQRSLTRQKNISTSAQTLPLKTMEAGDGAAARKSPLPTSPSNSSSVTSPSSDGGRVQSLPSPPDFRTGPSESHIVAGQVLGHTIASRAGLLDPARQVGVHDETESAGRTCTDSPKVGGGRRRVKFSENELEAIKRGILYFGFNDKAKWHNILNSYKDTFHPERTNVNLKDCFRNMVRRGDVTKEGDDYFIDGEKVPR